MLVNKKNKNMQEHFPSAPQEAAEATPVNLTAQEWQTLHMSADPQTDPEVMAIMAAKHIDFDGSPMDVSVAGTEEGEAAREFVMTTDPEDPFTLHRELTDKSMEAAHVRMTENLGEVVKTYDKGDDAENSLEGVLDGASQSHEEQVTRIVGAFDERLPGFVGKHTQETEQLGKLQTRITNRLNPVAERFARNAQLGPRDIDGILRELDLINKDMGAQLETVQSERRLSGVMKQGVNEVKSSVKARTEEYRAVINHLTEKVSDVDSGERQLEAGRTQEAALAGVISLEQDVYKLDDQLSVVDGTADERRRVLRLARSQLVELQETLRRTGRYDPDAARSVKLKVQSALDSHGLVGQKLKTLPTLRSPK